MNNIGNKIIVYRYEEMEGTSTYNQEKTWKSQWVKQICPVFIQTNLHNVQQEMRQPEGTQTTCWT